MFLVWGSYSAAKRGWVLEGLFRVKFYRHGMFYRKGWVVIQPFYWFLKFLRTSLRKHLLIWCYAYLDLITISPHLSLVNAFCLNWCGVTAGAECRGNNLPWKSCGRDSRILWKPAGSEVLLGIHFVCMCVCMDYSLLFDCAAQKCRPC